MSDKPFLTIDEQVRLLESRGLVVDADTGPTLMREGYYSIVNGYKDPFLDVGKSKEAGEDRYLEGISFSDLYTLFTFDRELRSLTFRYLILAEAKIKSAVSYAFSNAHRASEAYLLQSNYCDENEFASAGKNGSNFAQEIASLTSILGRRTSKSKSDFIVHYRSAYGAVPFWVLVNDLTFGNIEHFFNLMKPKDKSAVCKMVVDSTGRTGSRRLGFFSVDDARVSIEVLVKFRNVCAHDERLYCAKVGGRKNVNYIRMVWMLERYLTENEFKRFIKDLTDLLMRYVETYAIKHVLNQIGFVELLQKSTDGTLFE